MGDFRSWYEKNRDEHNAKRRQRYKENKELRDKARARARQYREDNAGSEPKEAKTKKVDGIILYPLRLVAERIGRHPQSIRRWESLDYIPDVREGGSSRHRFYTGNQVKLIQKLATFMDKHEARAIDPSKLAFLISKIHTKWEG